jgi:hypothetical protein
MGTFFAAVIVFAVAMLAMAVGVIFGRPNLRSRCGSLDGGRAPCANSKACGRPCARKLVVSGLNT